MSNAVEKVKHFDIVIVLLGVIIALLIGNIAFVGYCMHQNKVRYRDGKKLS